LESTHMIYGPAQRPDRIPSASTTRDSSTLNITTSLVAIDPYPQGVIDIMLSMK
jgi:hypothetical protein